MSEKGQGGGAAGRLTLVGTGIGTVSVLDDGTNVVADALEVRTSIGADVAVVVRQRAEVALHRCRRVV
jgi:hypothetical protein